MITDRLALIAHRGEGRCEPNSLAALDAALAAGADVIEFDVLALRRRLVLAHDPLDALRRRRTLVELPAALSHVAGPRFTGAQFNVDLKLPGYERRTVELLRGHGLLERCLISSQFLSSVRAVKEHAPHARTGLSVGGTLARAAHRWPRGGLTEAILARAGACGCDAVMLWHELACAPLVTTLRAGGLQPICWTVDCPDRARELHGLGVQAVSTGAVRALATA